MCTGPCKISEIVYFTSSRIKKIVALFTRFPVKLTFCIASGSASNLLLKPV